MPLPEALSPVGSVPARFMLMVPAAQSIAASSNDMSMYFLHLWLIELVSRTPQAAAETHIHASSIHHVEPDSQDFAQLHLASPRYSC
jgi:hypothetical protein